MGDADVPDPGWRDPRLKPQPTYSVHSSYFTVSVHHGGRWTVTDEGKRDYIGGIVSCFDYCDTDIFSTLDLDWLCVFIGKENHTGYWWTPLGSSVSDGRELRSDADCLIMFSHMLEMNYRDCHVYLVRALCEPDEVNADDEDSEEEHIEAQEQVQEQAQEQAFEAQEEAHEDIVEPEYGLDEEEVQGFGLNPNPPNWWNNQDDVGQDESDREIPLDESDLESLDEDSDGEPRVIRTTRTFTPGRPWSDFKFSLGLEFASVEQIREALREYFIHINRSFKWMENNRVKLRARCSSPGCPWVVYAHVQRRDSTTFRVNTLKNKHNCGIVFNSKHVNSEWLAKHFLDQFKMNPDMRFNNFHSLVANTKYSHCTRTMFYAVKKRALEILEGSSADQFAKLQDYCLQLRSLMPGSTAIVKSEMVNDQRLFQRVYICLQACKSGFRHCAWSKSHFDTHNKCDMLVNNMCESFNAAILEGRDKPVITMLEYIRVWLMRRFYRKRESVPTWIAPVGRRVLKVIEKNKEEARHCLAVRADQLLFQVNKGHSESFAVNLVDHTCTCRMLQLTGIPCAHVISAIWSANMNIYDFVVDGYKIESFVNQYAGVIVPVPSPDKWPQAGLSVIRPPKFNALPGRPKKKRSRSAGELAPGAEKARRIGQWNCCRKCGQRGHTRRTCTNQPSQPMERKKMGRPLKANVTPATLKRRERRARQLAQQASQSGPSEAGPSHAGPSQPTPPPPSQPIPPPSQPTPTPSEWSLF